VGWGLFRSVGFGAQGIAAALLGGMTVVFPSVVFAVVLGGGVTSVTGVIAGLVMLAILAFVGRRSGSLSDRQDGSWSDASWLLAISLVGLATRMWVFVLPYAAALAFVLVVQWYAQRKSAVVGRVVYPLGWVFVIIGAVWSSVLARDPASEGLIFRSADQYWRSSLGSAVIRFGVTDHPGAVGYPVRYHWLGEAQMGFLGLLSNTPIVDIVVRFSALGATFAAVLGVFVLARQIGLGRLEGYFAAILLAVLSTLLYSYGLNILKTTEMGQLWGTAFFLNGIALL